MAEISNLNPTTELEAVNSMLAALGEAPLTSLVAVTQPDYVTAINTLRDATREILTMGWRFNREWGFQILPAGTFAYTDNDGVTTGLNFFMAPPRLLRFEVSALFDQMSPKLDLTLRRARFLAVTVSGSGDSATVSTVSDITVSGSVHPLVFYDRVLNRDGLDSNRYDALWIDPIWAVDFEDMPETARRLATIIATRRFLASQAPAQPLQSFTDTDQRIALRDLKVDQGEDDDYNMLDNSDIRGAMGHRPWGPGVPLLDPRRRSPGSRY